MQVLTIACEPYRAALSSLHHDPTNPPKPRTAGLFVPTCSLGSIVGERPTHFGKFSLFWSWEDSSRQDKAAPRLQRGLFPSTAHLIHSGVLEGTTLKGPGRVGTFPGAAFSSSCRPHSYA